MLFPHYSEEVKQSLADGLKQSGEKILLGAAPEGALHGLNKGVKKQLRVEFLSYPKSTNVIRK